MKGIQFSRNLYISSFPSFAGRSMHWAMCPQQVGGIGLRAAVVSTEVRQGLLPGPPA
jgi:hypothetical protein